MVTATRSSTSSYLGTREGLQQRGLGGGVRLHGLGHLAGPRPRGYRYMSDADDEKYARHAFVMELSYRHIYAARFDAQSYTVSAQSGWFKSAKWGE